MSGYVSELLDYLDLYKLLLENGYYNPEKKEDAKELLDLIDSLEECTDNHKLKEFNFNILKRKVNNIFHPDLYKEEIPTSLNIDNIELIKKVNGLLSDIDKEEKKSSFTYNPAKPFYNDYEDRYSDDYTHNDYYYNDVPFGKAEEFDDDLEREKRREERRAKFDGFMSDLKSGVSKTKDYIYEVAKDRFNAMFRDIPANEKDYNNIRNRYESSLNNLSRREMVLAQSLFILKSNKNDLQNRWNMDTSNYSVDRYYKIEFNKVINNLKSIESELSGCTAQYKGMLVKYAPEYNRLLNDWIKTTSEIYTDIINANHELNENKLFNPNEKNAKCIQKRLDRFNKERDNLPNINEAKIQINNHLLEIHDDYRDVFERFNDTRIRYDKAYKEYEYYRIHERDIKDNYYHNVNDRYNAEYIKINNRINTVERKHNKIVKTIFDTRVRFGEFLDKYQEKYESNTDNYEYENTTSRKK